MTFLNPIKPSQSKNIAEALNKIRPLMLIAKQRVQAIPTEEMINSFSGETELVKIATAEMLQRIMIDVFGLKLIVDTQLIDQSDSPTVSATVFILTEDGYQPLRTSTASEQRGAGNFSPVLSAESRAIRLVLRSIGLRAEGEIFDVENVDQIKDSRSFATEENQPHVSGGKKSQAKKQDNAQHNDTVSSRQKKKREQTAQAAETTQSDTPEYFGVTLDRNAIDYVDKMRQVLRLAKAQNLKSVSIADFIQTVLGPNSAKRLEGCTTGELEKLVANYVINSDSTI